MLLTQGSHEMVRSIGRQTKVLIVDDHELVRDGLRQLIGSDIRMTVCGEAESLSAAKQVFKESQPDVVVVDLSLQDSNGLDLIKWLAQQQPPAKILVSTMRDERDYGERAFRAGASGYVNKQQPARLLLEAIHTLLDGKLYFSDSLIDQFLRRARVGKSPTDSAIEDLSDRELEIFLLIGKGQSTDEIASQLFLSPNTIGTYRERLKNKLSLKNAAELTRCAVMWVTNQEA